MFDPKLAGEEADRLIAEQNQKPSEDQSGDNSEAIVHDVQETSIDDTTPATPTPENVVNNETNKKLDAMSRQLEAAEQRWKVLQGMIDKKDAELESYRALLAQLSEKPAAQEVSDKPSVTQNDIDVFGSDLTEFVERVSASSSSRYLKRLDEVEQRIKNLEGSVQGVQQATTKTATETFFDRLANKVPDWEALNSDPSFIAWLNEVDPFTGTAKMGLLHDAVQMQDVGRAATFFTEYKKLTAPPEDLATKADNVTKLVSPGKTKGQTPRVDGNSKRMWSRTDITKLYDDKMAGRISQKDFDALERDLFAAQREGRYAA